MKNWVIGKLIGSRKFWMTLIGSLLVYFNENQQWGLSSDTINALAVIVVGYIVGQGIADAGAGKPDVE